MPSHTDPRAHLWGGDIPLPGLDLLPAPAPAMAVRRSRPYSSTLPPTQAAIDAFWSRVVKAPGSGCWIWTGAVSDGYGRNRAELHLVGYSTAE